MGGTRADSCSALRYAIQFVTDATATLAELKKNYADAWPMITERLYDSHLVLADVLGQEYREGAVSYVNPSNGTPGYLRRAKQGCDFCVNANWEFPLGCSYGKLTEKQASRETLLEVTRHIVKKGPLT